MGKLSDYINAYFKCKTRTIPNPVIAAAGAAAAIVFRNNPDRLAWTFVNLSANPIFLGLSDQVTAINGFYVAPNGGNVTALPLEDFEGVGWAWWCIAPAGASACHSLEVIGS